MKKLFLLITVVACCHASQAQFTANNIVALRISDSIAAFANTGNTVALDQFTTTGTFVNTTLMPRTGSSAVAISGSATSEGQLTLSSNFTTLNFFAYKAAPPYTSSLAGTTSSAVNRVIVSVNAAGTVSLPTLTASTFSANNPRGAVSDGSGFWGIGGNSGVCFGNATSNIDTVVAPTPANIRSVNIFAGQLFACTGSGSVGIYRIGNGAPSASGSTGSLYIATNIGSSPSPYSFAFNPDTTTCYVSDDRSIANGGGIMKFTRTGSTWSLAYTLGTGTSSTVGSRSITVNWGGTNPVIYATTAESTLNRIIKITDTGAGAVAITLATAVANTIYRGIAFTPGSNPLPVSWLSISANKVKNGVMLSWSTASETNNARFEVQRSADNEKFAVIGEMKGAGNSASMLSYRFTDLSPLAGTAYYRIRQIDMDGKSTYSTTVSMDAAAGTATSALKQTLPNPFSNELNITVNAATAGTATVEVTDMLGKTHYSGTETLTAGDQTITINTAHFDDGVYFVRMTINGEVFTRKIIRK